MRRFLYALMVLLWAFPALAQVPMTGAGLAIPATGGGYTGPGDLTTFVAWYSSGRAYSAAYAAPGTNKAFQVCDTSTGLTCFDALVQTNGKVNQAAVVASSACSVACFYKQFYDQTGNGNHLLQDAGTLTFSANTLVSLPCGIMTGTQRFKKTTFAQAQPFTLSVFANNVAAANSPILADSAGGLSNYLKNGTAGVFAGTADQTTPATDGAYHAVQFTINGASSIINVDGTDHALAGTPGAGGFANNLFLGGDGFGTDASATVCEAGILSGAANSTIRGNLATNQAGFW